MWDTKKHECPGNRAKVDNGHTVVNGCQLDIRLSTGHTVDNWAYGCHLDMRLTTGHAVDNWTYG